MQDCDAALTSCLNHHHHHPTPLPPTTPPGVSTKQVAHFSCEDLCAEPKRVTMAFVARDAGTSAARRRRELRYTLRCEWMTVAMALAEMTHHSAARRPTMARARGRGE